MISCQILLDREVIAGRPGQGLAAISDVRISWGRSAILDQPRASTAQVRLLLPDDRPGEALASLQVGRALAVHGSYTADDGDLPVFTRPDHVDLVGATQPGPSSYRPAPGWVESLVYVLPAPYGGPEHPDAWDHLPKAGAGTRFTLSGYLDLAPGQQAWIYPVYFTAPDPQTAQMGASVQTVTTSGPVQAAWTIPPAHAGKWVGIAIQINPVGKSWAAFLSPWSTVAQTWDELSTFQIPSLALTSHGSITWELGIFGGRLSDVQASFDERLGRPVAYLTATDISAELANAPLEETDDLPTQTAGERISQIADQIPIFLLSVIDPRPAALSLASTPARTKTAWQLLTQIATSTGSVLWPAYHPKLRDHVRLEDPTRRQALYDLTVPPSGPITLDIGDGAIALPAGVLDRAPIQLVQDTSDVASVVQVSWALEGQDDDGAPTREDQTVQLIDGPRVAQYGYRQIQVSTDLTNSADANALAALHMAAAAPLGHLIRQARWDLSIPGSDPQTAIALLDSLRRIGLPVVLEDLPDWVPGAPSQVTYLDGGQYEFHAGTWSLDLLLTPAAYPAASVRWDQLPPPVTWARMSELTWNHLSIARI